MNIETRDITETDLEIKEHLPGQKEERATIGGTLAKAIMGVSKYATPYQAFKYLSEEDEVEEEDISDKIPIILGTHLEEPVLKITAEHPHVFLTEFPKWKNVYRTDKQYIDWKTYIHNEVDLENMKTTSAVKKQIGFSAHIDGWGIDENDDNFLIEIKNYSTWAHKGYKDVEDQEKVQIQHYLSVFKDYFKYCILIVRIDNQIKTFKIDSDSEQQSYQKNEINTFHINFVFPKLEPAILPADMDFLKLEFTPSVDYADLNKEEEKQMENALMNYSAESFHIKRHTEKKDQAKATIMLLLKNAFKYENASYKVSRSIYKSLRADTAKLKKDMLLEKYSKISEIDKLTITKNKDS